MMHMSNSVSYLMEIYIHGERRKIKEEAETTSCTRGLEGYVGIRSLLRLASYLILK